jgi:hypothetical protein
MKLSNFPYLFSITDRFSLTDRGVVVVPGIPREGVPVVKRGDPLILRTPLGKIIETTLRDLEMISYRPGGTPAKATPILLPSSLHKFDIPIGTEVFLGVANPTQAKGP